MTGEIFKAGADAFGCEYEERFVRELLADAEFVELAKRSQPSVWREWGSHADPDFARASVTLGDRCAPALTFGGQAPDEAAAKAYIKRVLFFDVCADAYFAALAKAGKPGFAVSSYLPSPKNGRVFTCRFDSGSGLSVKLTLLPYEANTAGTPLLGSSVLIGVRLSGDARYCDAHTCAIGDLSGLGPLNAALSKYSQLLRR